MKSTCKYWPFWIVYLGRLLFQLPRHLLRKLVNLRSQIIMPSYSLDRNQVQPRDGFICGDWITNWNRLREETAIFLSSEEIKHTFSYSIVTRSLLIQRLANFRWAADVPDTTESIHWQGLCLCYCCGTFQMIMLLLYLVTMAALVQKLHRLTLRSYTAKKITISNLKGVPCSFGEHILILNFKLCSGKCIFLWERLVHSLFDLIYIVLMTYAKTTPHQLVVKMSYHTYHKTQSPRK